jgi:hypothetical protein
MVECIQVVSVQMQCIPVVSVQIQCIQVVSIQTQALSSYRCIVTLLLLQMAQGSFNRFCRGKTFVSGGKFLYPVCFHLIKEVAFTALRLPKWRIKTKPFFLNTDISIPTTWKLNFNRINVPKIPEICDPNP